MAECLFCAQQGRRHQQHYHGQVARRAVTTGDLAHCKRRRVPAADDTDRLRRRRCGAYHRYWRRHCTGLQEEHEVIAYPDAGVSNVRFSLCASDLGDWTHRHPERVSTRL